MLCYIITLQHMDSYCEPPPFSPPLPQVGFSVLQRSGGAPVTLDPPLSITHQALRPLESLMKCVEMGWMSVLVGPTASGKTSLVRLLALLTGHRLRVMAMNSAMDTTELLGGFEQVSPGPTTPPQPQRTQPLLCMLYVLAPKMLGAPLGLALMLRPLLGLALMLALMLVPY